MEIPFQIYKLTKWRVAKSQAQKSASFRMILNPCFSKELGGFCCPVPPGPRSSANYLTSAMRRLGSDSDIAHVNIVVGIYKSDPITAVSCRAKTMSLLHASILFRPRLITRRAGDQVEAPGTAPGSAASILQGVYRHSRQADRCIYSIFLVKKKVKADFGLYSLI